MNRVRRLLLASAVICSIWAVRAEAASPVVIPYQGKLTDASGAVINGAQSIRFSLWNAAAAGVELWNETQATVAVANGLFNVDLGTASAIPTSIFTGNDLFLEIKVGADAAMTPRQRLGSVGYAIRAGIMPAVANAVSGPFSATGLENLTSLSVTFPAAGTAVVIGNIDCNATITGTQCYGLSINDVSGVQGLENFECITSSGYRETSITNERVFSVAAGAKTFFLVGDEQSGSWSIYRARLVVMYFPDTIGPVNTTEPQQAPTASQRVGNSTR